MSFAEILNAAHQLPGQIVLLTFFRGWVGGEMIIFPHLRDCPMSVGIQQRFCETYKPLELWFNGLVIYQVLHFRRRLVGSGGDFLASTGPLPREYVETLEGRGALPSRLGVIRMEAAV